MAGSLALQRPDLGPRPQTAPSEEAEKSISDRDPDDWPTVALALKLDLPVWTQDKDHTDARIRVFTTGDLLDALRDAGDIE